MDIGSGCARNELLEPSEYILIIYLDSPQEENRTHAAAEYQGKRMYLKDLVEGDREDIMLHETGSSSPGHLWFWLQEQAETWVVLRPDPMYLDYYIILSTSASGELEFQTLHKSFLYASTARTFV